MLVQMGFVIQAKPISCGLSCHKTFQNLQSVDDHTSTQLLFFTMWQLLSLVGKSKVATRCLPHGSEFRVDLLLNLLLHKTRNAGKRKRLDKI